MTKEDNKSKGGIIAAIIGAVVVVAAVVITIVLINNNNKNGASNNGNETSNNEGEVLDDDFFKTSDTKIVISNDGNSDDPAVAKRVHQVYTVDGDKITGLKVYSEFESEQAAKDADAKPEVAEAMKTGMYKDHKVQGKFIIVTMADSAYESVTAEQLRMSAGIIEQAAQAQNGADQQSQTTEETTEETEE